MKKSGFCASEGTKLHDHCPGIAIILNEGRLL